MSNEAASGNDEESVDQRTQRARSEDMLVALRKSGGIYSVRGESGNTYRVDIAMGECSCPDYQKPSIERCKHLRRVEMELRNRTVPTPDGRLPERPVTDGGVGTNQTQPDRGRRVEGPLQDFDKHGRPTGVDYYRCSVCGTEAMRRQDLSKCCPVARR